MTQTKLGSAVETTLNIGSGVLIAVAMTYWILPLWGYQYTVGQSVGITALYTSVSWVRSYAWRRLFAKST